VPPVATLGVVAGLLAGLWWPPALVLPVGYLAAVALAAVAVGRSPAIVARLLAVYPAMHLSWGAGFLAGPPRESGRPGSGQEAS
jgi:hypothetical protein